MFLRKQKKSRLARNRIFWLSDQRAGKSCAVAPGKATHLPVGPQAEKYFIRATVLKGWGFGVPLIIRKSVIIILIHLEHLQYVWRK